MSCNNLCMAKNKYANLFKFATFYKITATETNFHDKIKIGFNSRTGK